MRLLNNRLFKKMFWLCAVGTVFYGTAVTATTLGDVASTVTDTFANVAKLITALAYIAGMGFAVGAILKFKQHKDNPTQIPIGTPIALLFVAAALIFLPTIFSVTGQTLFGSSAVQGGVTGVSAFT